EGHTGTVEAINLRITQLRNIQGSLITIPNSQIGIIQNLSKDWSQVDLSFTVTPTTDLTEACCLLQETAAQLAEDADWRRFILEPPDLLGIDNIDHTGVTLRLLLKTQPSKQWLVARELRRRIKFAFDEANIRMGLPQERLELHWQEGAATLKTLET
ncbi:MAG: mechanosensitive ion channel domain-containing protein, partial [Cyanobacteria bacterium J06631_9]